MVNDLVDSQISWFTRWLFLYATCSRLFHIHNHLPPTANFFKVSSLQTNYTTVCQEHSRDLWLIWCSSVMELKERTLQSLGGGQQQHAWHDVTFPVSCALTALVCRASIKTPHMNWVSAALTPVCCYDWELYCSYLPVSPWLMSCVCSEPTPQGPVSFSLSVVNSHLNQLSAASRSSPDAPAESRSSSWSESAPV